MEPSHLTLPIKVLPHGEGLPLPDYQSPEAAGLDLRAAIEQDKPFIIHPHNHCFVPSGIALVIPFGFEGQIRPRSGLALKFGVTVLNSPGTIDSDYRGEIGVLLVNLGNEPFTPRARRPDRPACDRSCRPRSSGSCPSPRRDRARRKWLWIDGLTTKKNRRPKHVKTFEATRPR